MRILRRVPVESGATYLIRRDVLEITTTDALRKEFFPDRPAGPLLPLVTIKLDKTPLESALKSLRYWGNVVLDSRAEKVAQTPVTADVENVPLDTAVRMLANMAGLKVVPLENALYVTSPDSAEEMLQEQEALRQQREREQKEKAREACEKAKTPTPTATPPKAANEPGKKSS
jgi:hypothetical protein